MTETEDVEYNPLGAILRAQAEHEEIPPEEIAVTPEDLAADDIMKDEPLDFFERIFAGIHCGDCESLRAVVYSACLQSSVTSRGLHPTVTGGKGSGKSSGVKAALHLLPPKHVKSGSVSPKAVLFMRVPEKTIFFLDDIEYNPEFNSLAKRSMTNFQCATIHTTVAASGGKSQKMTAVEVSLAKRCVFATTSVHPMGDDQLQDRQLGFASSCTDADYMKWEQERRLSGREDLPVTMPVKICRKIMERIYSNNFVVTHHRKIKFAFGNDRRLVNQLYDLVEASAILHYMQRNPVPDSTGIYHITTRDEDLKNALSFSMFSNASDATEGRLTPAERKMDMILVQNMPSSMPEISYTEKQIAEMYGRSIQAIRKLLYGVKGNANDIHGGLLDKTKWYLPDTDQQHQRVIVVKRHKIIYDITFAEWE